jgi:predicted 3-demethylubiquinone-9 3-methyltransferase (glyoxalase superfamily)
MSLATQNIVTCLWLDDQGENAVNLYVSILPK